MSDPAADDEMAALVAEHSERLFADLSTPDRLTAADRGEWPADAWQQLRLSGFLDAMVATQAGGAGLGAPDAFKLARRAGYHALPLPVGETLLARALWCGAGGALDELAGPWTLSTAIRPDALRIELRDGGAKVQGELPRLPWGSRADLALAEASDAAGRRFLLRLSLRSAGCRSSANLASEPRDSVVVDLPLDEAAMLPLARSSATPLPLLAGALLRAQQMAGAMQRCLELSLRYAAERVQFGKPIASFPAVQAMLVDAAGQVAAASAAADLAATRWQAPAADVELLVGVAKSRAGESAGRVAALCHQVHGAIGFTQEHVLHHSTRRLWAWRDEFGSESWWNRRIGELACAQGAEGLWPALTRL